jgi:signal transduction histidine kinase
VDTKDEHCLSVRQEDLYKRLLAVNGLPERLAILGEKIEALGIVDGYFFNIVDETRQYLTCEYLSLSPEFKPMEDAYRSLRWPLSDDDENAHSFKEARIVYIDAADTGQWHRNTQMRFERFKMGSMVLIPIRLQTESIGTLMLFTRDGTIGTETVDAIAAMLRETGEAIENARHYSALAQGKANYLRSTTEREQLIDFISEATSIAEIDDIDNRLIKRFLTYFDFDFVLLYLVDGNHAVVRTAVSLNGDTQNALDAVFSYLKPIQLDATAGGVPATILRKSSCYMVKDVQKMQYMPIAPSDRTRINLLADFGLSLKGLIHVPIFYGSQVLGTLSCYSTSKMVDLEPGQVRMIELLARFFGAAIANAKQLQHLKDERNRLVAEATAALESERQTIARNLHDGMGAFLSQMSWLFDGLKKSTSNLDINSVASEKILEICDAGKKAVTQAYAEVSRAVTELRPEEVSIVGLRGAIEYLMDTWQKTAPDVEFNCEICPELDKVDPRKSGILFRLVQEALTNVMRHTSPNNVAVNFQCVHKLLRLTVASQGNILKEYAGENVAPRMLRERTTLLGGNMKFEYSVSKQSSKVVITIPL